MRLRPVLILLCLLLAAITVVNVVLNSWALSMGGTGAAIVGAIVLGRRPGNGVGVALIFLGFATVLSDFTTGYLERWVVDNPLPLEGVMSILGGSIFPLVGTGICALLLVYPTGSPRGRWRLVLWGVVAVGALGVLSGIIWSSARTVGEVALEMTAHEGTDNPADLAAAAIFFLGLPLSVASLVARYRAGSVVERLQVRWLLLAGGFLFLSTLALNMMGDFESLASQIITSVAFVLIPVSIGIAVTRYRLYEIDRLISRTVSYALVVSMLAGVFAGGVLLLQRLLPFQSDLAVAASTLAVAALFNPLRRRVQDAVDRRFNRARYDAQRTVGAFAGRLRDAVDLDEIQAELYGVVERTVEPAHLSLWVRPGPEARR